MGFEAEVLDQAFIDSMGDPHVHRAVDADEHIAAGGPMTASLRFSPSAMQILERLQRVEDCLSSLNAPGHEQSMSMITRQTASGWDRGSQGLPPNDRQCLNLPFTIL